MLVSNMVSIADVHGLCVCDGLGSGIWWRVVGIE